MGNLFKGKGVKNWVLRTFSRASLRCARASTPPREARVGDPGLRRKEGEI